MLHTLITIMFMLVPSWCFAQSTSSAMKEYGILGTWSPDCASSVMKGADRITFDVPTLGSPTVTDQTSGGSIIITRVSEVHAAERITQDKIRLTRSLRKFIGSAGPIDIPPGDDRAKPQSLLLEKLGQKLQLNGVFILERCLN